MVGLSVAACVLALLANREFRDLARSLERIRPSTALKPAGSAIEESLDT
jgi:hypothetical protein